MPPTLTIRPRRLNCIPEAFRCGFRLTGYGAIAADKECATVAFVRFLTLISGRGGPVTIWPKPSSREELNMATLCLLGNDGAMAGQWEIGDAPVTVGRSAPVDVQVEDDGLSRRHFMIAREGAEYVIKDLSSRNGTWVHGRRALAARLRHNDCILAGHALFRFCEEHAAVSPALQSVSGPHRTEVLFPAAPTGRDRTAAGP